MPKRIFIAGTDTGVGKTYISCGLLQALNQKGLKTIGIKPVASGCEEIENQLKNEDALFLQKNSTIKLAYDQINPFAFKLPIAPHIGAMLQGISLNVKMIADSCKQALDTSADVFIIEGAGGFIVPLNETESLADLVVELQAEVILVVAIRLGCLNHALLSVEAIKNKGCKLIGWVANCQDSSMPYYQENIDTLKNRISAPLLGTILANSVVSTCIDINKII